MKLIREVTGYTTSKDYEKLFEIAQHQSVICLCQYSELCIDIAHTIYKRNNIEVCARGTGYVTAFGIDEFIEQCQACGLAWIPPDKE